jgi:hypothetical protein
MRKLPKTFLLLCLMGSALTLPAHAEDVPPVVQALLHNFEIRTGGTAPTYDSIDVDGSGNITIKALKFSKAGDAGKPGVEATVDQITLEGIDDQGDGKFEIANSAYTGMNLAISAPDGQNIAVSVPEMSAEGWQLRTVTDNPTPEEAFRQSMTLVKKMTSGKITVTAMGQTVSSDGFEGGWDGDSETGAGSFSGKIKNIVIPASLLDMSGAGPMLKQLGYDDLSLDVGADGKMDVGDGKVNYNFTAYYIGRGVGNLKLTFAADGIPMSLFAEMQSAESSGQPPDFAKLLPELQAVSLNGASIRFEDDSITKKLLPMLAAMQGMDEATLVQSAGPMLQMGLMQLNNPEFATQVAGAVNAFLKEPKSLTVALKPASPVKVEQLMGLNPGDPAAAISLLGVTVTSND